MFYIFAGMSYYPAGGFKDLTYASPFATQVDAMKAICNLSTIDWWQIVEIVDGEMTLVDEGVRA